MRLPGLLFKLGTVDVTSIESEVSKLTQKQWLEWNLRQSKYRVHSTTETYPFMFSEYGEEAKQYNLDTNIWKVTKPIVEQLENFYNRKAGVVILVKLKPKTTIPEHEDGGWFVNTHRVHIPIITDPNIFFTFLQDRQYMYHLKRGEIYEFNNIVKHGVINQTNIARVHLLVDMLPKSIANPAILKSPLESIGYESLKINELLTP